MKWSGTPRHTAEVGTTDFSSYSELPHLSPAAMPSRYEQRLKSRNEKRQQPHKFARKLAATAIAASVATGSIYNAFMFDQRVVSEIVWGNDKASVEILANNTESTDEARTYIYVLPNTGIRNATPTALALKDSFATIPRSQLMALTEGAHPQLYDTLNAITATLDEKNLPNQFVLYGTSVGGKEALAIADHLRDIVPNSDISIILSSSPYNEQSAYALQGDNNKLPFIADIAARNKLHGGPIARIVAESGMKVNERCFTPAGSFDLNSCIAMIKETARENTSVTTGSNELLEWQVQWTRVNSVGQDMHKLRNVKNGPRTDILYINTTQDVIVDEQQAIPLYKADAIENNIPITISPIDVPHSTEHLFPDAYRTQVLDKYFANIPAIQESVDAKLGSTIRDDDYTGGSGKPQSML